MIRIKHFSPLESLMTREWQFDEDKLVVKAKSLSVDDRVEVSYRKIGAIQNRRITDLHWLWLPFLISGLVVTAHVLLPIVGVSNGNPYVSWAEKIMLLLAYALGLPAFQSFELYSFLDAEGSRLATVIVDGRSKPLLLEAIERIRKTGEPIRETYISDPLPSEPPLFKITDFNFPDFLSTSTARFYDDRLIDHEKSLVEEAVNVVRYDELGQEPRMAKLGNEKWDVVWGWWFMVLSIAASAAIVFFPQVLCGNKSFGALVVAGYALLVPLFFLKYIKSEILVLSDKKGRVVFWTRVSRENRERIKRLATFLQGKTAAPNTPP